MFTDSIYVERTTVKSINTAESYNGENHLDTSTHQLTDYHSEMAGDSVIIYVNLVNATLDKANDFKIYIERIINSGVKSIIVDLTLCRIIDSTFWGTLIFTTKLLNRMNGSIRLVYNDKKTSPIFMVTSLERIFDIYPDISTAVENSQI